MNNPNYTNCQLLQEVAQRLKPNCKLNRIVSQLDDYTWRDLHSDFVVKYYNSCSDYGCRGFLVKKEWEKRGFSKKQIKEWIKVGIDPRDYRFISYLRNVKEFNAKNFLNDRKVKDYEDLRRKCRKYDWCSKCKQINTSIDWCQPCLEKEWKEDLRQLDGKEVIEKFTQQYLEKEGYINYNRRLKWIPYEEFTDLKYLAQGGFSKIYKAKWERERKSWEDDYVVLKSLNNSQNVTLELLREVANNIVVDDWFREDLFFRESYFVKCYGISRDPQTKNYVMVMEYVSYSLRNYLRNNTNNLSLLDRLSESTEISRGLKDIHYQNMVHRDFHQGNILTNGDNNHSYSIRISDLGLSRTVDFQEEGEIFGVLPYVAPEVLRGKPYTQASDIYSLGMVMYEVVTSLPPFCSEEHGTDLALKICQGDRPQFPTQVKYPQLLVDLITSCWNNDPEQRPDVWEVVKSLNSEETREQCKEIEEYNKTLPEEIKYPNYQTKETVWHSKAINTKQITELLKKLKVEEYQHSANLELDLNNFNLDELNLQEDPQAESSTQAQIEIPAKW